MRCSFLCSLFDGNALHILSVTRSSSGVQGNCVCSQVSYSIILDSVLAGVRCDPCGAVQHTAPQGSQRTPATCIAATTPELTVGILNSAF